jgi:hypothetical protein
MTQARAAPSMPTRQTWWLSDPCYTAAAHGLISAHMAYYQEVVVEYLREKRWMFLNTDFCIQLNEAKNPDTSGPHWYCDVVAVDFSTQVVHLCEVTYARGLSALVARLAAWNTNWTGVVAAVHRDGKVPPEWTVAPWIFIPEKFQSSAKAKIANFAPKPGTPGAMPIPTVTTLESLVPWNPDRWPALELAKSSLIEGTTK